MFSRQQGIHLFKGAVTAVTLVVACVTLTACEGIMGPVNNDEPIPPQGAVIELISEGRCGGSVRINNGDLLKIRSTTVLRVAPGEYFITYQACGDAPPVGFLEPGGGCQCDPWNARKVILQERGYVAIRL